MRGLHWIHKEDCKTIWGSGCSCHVIENEQALLRVARAAKNRKNAGMDFDEIGEAQDEFEEALKEVEHLLE